jgi:hypothetical protein
LEPYRRVILQSEFVIRDSTRDRRWRNRDSIFLFYLTGSDTRQGG